MKIMLLSLLMSFGVWAESPGLFGKVIHVAKNDTLNVRAEPNYKAKKVAEIAPFLTVGIEQCKTIKSSTWCRVYALVQNWSDKFGDRDRGWVNATYLQFSNRGYVTMTDKDKHCFYVIECREDNGTQKCLVVLDYKYDYEKDKMLELKTKWIERKKLKGESEFGAISENRDINPEGGYCTNHRMIEDYLEKNLEK